MSSCTGMTHLYYGDGKGKTTAAVGLALRCLGAGKKVLFVQFLKNGVSCELAPMQKLGITLWQADDTGKFTFQMNETERLRCCENCTNCMKNVMESALSGEYEAIFLDEVVDAVRLGMIKEELLFTLLKDKPAGLELVLTGHQPNTKLIEACDYVSDIRKVKHPFEKGIAARRGIEY